MGWCESARFQILRFSEILPEEWVPGGIIILARETKIAEMKLSEPYKNDFQLLTKSVQKKLKIFAWEIGENLKKSRKFRTRSLVMYIPPKDPDAKAMLPVTEPNI